MATTRFGQLTLGRSLVCEGVKDRLGELSAECRTGKQSLNSSMVSGCALADIKEAERYGPPKKC